MEFVQPACALYSGWYVSKFCSLFLSSSLIHTPAHKSFKTNICHGFRHPFVSYRNSAEAQKATQKITAVGSDWEISLTCNSGDVHRSTIARLREKLDDPETRWLVLTIVMSPVGPPPSRLWSRPTSDLSVRACLSGALSAVVSLGTNLQQSYEAGKNGSTNALNTLTRHHDCWLEHDKAEVKVDRQC